MKGPLDLFMEHGRDTSSDQETTQCNDNQTTQVGTDPSHSRTVIKNNPKTCLQTTLPTSGSISRNHSFVKRKMDETVVSSKVPAEAILPSGTVRSVLRLVDSWHSGYSSVQCMLDYLRLRKSGSLQSARTICESLGRFCKDSGIDPDTFVGFPREQIEARIQRHCDRIAERSRLRGRSANYPNTVLASLKTFFACNGFKRENGLELRVQGYRQPPRTTNRPEYIPSLKEALAMADRVGSKRNRAIILTAITTGFRSSALRAIRIDDVLFELEQGQRVVCIGIDATWNDRIPGACKNCIPYYTFMHEVATHAVHSMLREREDYFGSYSSDEPLFVSKYNQLPLSRRRLKALTSRELQIIMHKAAHAADISEWQNVHVHTMRKVFESVLRAPLVDGSAMDSKDQEFLMGHLLRGSQENYYDRSKKERMRELCSKLVFRDMSSIQELDLRATQKIAKLLGVDAEDVKERKQKELGRTISNQELEELLEEEIKLSYESRNKERQKVILLSELDQYVGLGWSVVTQLTDGRLVVKGPPEPRS